MPCLTAQEEKTVIANAQEDNLTLKYNKQPDLTRKYAFITWALWKVPQAEINPNMKDLPPSTAKPLAPLTASPQPNLTSR
jgi:hypothetical protein